MKKHIGLFLLIMLMVIMAGCGRSGESYINVEWHEHGEGQTISSAPKWFEGNKVYADIITDVKYSRIDFEMEEVDVTVLAEYYDNGEKVEGAEFIFNVTSGPIYSIVSQDIDSITIDFDTPGEGIVRVTHVASDETADVPFEIYPAAAIGSNIHEPTVDYGYDFSSASNVPAANGDIWYEESAEFGHYGYIHAPLGWTSINRDGYWGTFPDITDISNYDYSNTVKFEPDYGKIYFIKTNDGYAKMMFSVYRDDPIWGFVYDFSPDGTF